MTLIIEMSGKHYAKNVCEFDDEAVAWMENMVNSGNVVHAGDDLEFLCDDLGIDPMMVEMT